ncbi:hypothetical protein L1887_32700 [Cichorium endivia]|nr:hypothetical protein L1887_32700 [Cichorium endivia]
MSNGPSINQPLWDELKNAPEDNRILKEMYKENEQIKMPTPETVRLIGKASEALLGTLPLLSLWPGGHTGTDFRTTILSDSWAVMDCKTGDLDITFGTRKRRLNMFGFPMRLPPGDDNPYLNSKPLMAPRANDKGRNQRKDNESESEDKEILWKSRGHLLTTSDKQQIFDRMEAMERKYQEDARDLRNREAKAFQLLSTQQQWISHVRIHSTRQVCGQSKDIERVEGRDVEGIKARRVWLITDRDIRSYSSWKYLRRPRATVFDLGSSVPDQSSGRAGSAHSETLADALGSTSRQRWTVLTFHRSLSPASEISLRGRLMQLFGQRCPTRCLRLVQPEKASSVIRSTDSCSGLCPPPSCRGGGARRCPMMISTTCGSSLTPTGFSTCNSLWQLRWYPGRRDRPPRAPWLAGTSLPA